jgi:hypothetical protein
MSLIATFLKMPATALDGLREAAVPKKKFFGSTTDTYRAYLQEHSTPVVDYRWSGSVLAVLTEYLKEKHQIDLAASKYAELAMYLSKARKTSHEILTPSQSAAFLDRLDPALFSEEELRKYCNEFYGTDDQEVGKGMLDGLAALRQCLSSLDEGSVAILIIG